MLAAPRHLNCRGKTTRKYVDRPQKYPPNIKWTLRWFEFCKYQLLDWFLGTSIHQKKNTGLRNRALNSTLQPAVKCCLRSSFSYQTIPVCTHVLSGAHSPWRRRSSPSTTKTETDALHISIYQAARDRTQSHSLPLSGLPLNYMSTAHTNKTLRAQFLFSNSQLLLQGRKTVSSQCMFGSRRPRFKQKHATTLFIWLWGKF